MIFLVAPKLGVTVKQSDRLTRRVGAAELREATFTHGGMEILQRAESSIALAYVAFKDAFQLLPAPADLWSRRRRPHGLE